MNKKAKIYIAGYDSVVGRNIFEKLALKGYSNIIKTTHRELDLTRQAEVENFFEYEQIEYVFLVAAYAKGIIENKKEPAVNFIINATIQNNVLSCCRKYNIKKTLFFSSDGALPDITDRVLTEDDLFTANLIKNLEPYSLAKLCGTKLCSYYNYELNNICFVSLLPCYIYGGLKIPSLFFSLIEDFHKAKIDHRDCVNVWGIPEDKYQLLHFSDVADAAILLMIKHTKHDFYIVSSDIVYTKKQLTEQIKEIIGYTGKIYFDETKIIRASIRETSAGRLRNLGWSQSISLKEGLRSMYESFLKEYYPPPPPPTHTHKIKFDSDAVIYRLKYFYQIQISNLRHLCQKGLRCA